MAFDITVPTSNEPLALVLNLCDSLFVLGANGSGKSSLMQQIYKNHSDHAIRITAHRQTWLLSGEIEMTPRNRTNTQQNLRNVDINPTSRWRDDFAAERPNLVLYDLLNSENLRAREIAKAVDSDSKEEARAIATSRLSPLAIINKVLKDSNIPVKISLNDRDALTANRVGYPPYSIAELSDGERNAVLIAAMVLTAKPETLVLIDEPERHLHKSIAQPLLRQIFASREDLAFVVSTHDLSLPTSTRSTSLVLRGCDYSNAQALRWDVTPVSGSLDLDERLKQDILGARTSLLFVEGNEVSLDQSIYRIIFPGVTVVSKGSSREVERAVIGIRGVTELHWLNAHGIIDNDGRNSQEIEKKVEDGICVLPVFSIESIYYLPIIQSEIAARYANVVGESSECNIERAHDLVLKYASEHLNRLCSRVVEKNVRELILKQMPTWRDVKNGNSLRIKIDAGDVLEKEVNELNEAIKHKDIEKIICRYPLRETPALDAVAKALGFQSRVAYESAVRTLLKERDDLVSLIIGLFGKIGVQIP